MKKDKKYEHEWPIVVVRWRDSASLNSGWSYLKSIPEFKPHSVISIGYLFIDDPEFVVIIPHVSDVNRQAADRQIDGSMSIPKSQILWMKELYER